MYSSDQNASRIQTPTKIKQDKQSKNGKSPQKLNKTNQKKTSKEMFQNCELKKKLKSSIHNKKKVIIDWYYLKY